GLSPTTPALSQNRDRSNSRRNSAVLAMEFCDRVDDSPPESVKMGAAVTEHEASHCLRRFAAPASAQIIGMPVSSVFNGMRDRLQKSQRPDNFRVNESALRSGDL